MGKIFSRKRKKAKEEELSSSPGAQVECPECGAAPGVSCREKGNPIGYIHHARVFPAGPKPPMVHSVDIDKLVREERSVDTGLLDTAKDIIADRQRKYGSPRKDMERIAQMWSAVLGVRVKPEFVPLCMEAVKISRAVNEYHEDNAIDGCGYWQVYESCMAKDRSLSEAV